MTGDLVSGVLTSNSQIEVDGLQGSNLSSEEQAIAHLYDKLPPAFFKVQRFDLDNQKLKPGEKLTGTLFVYHPSEQVKLGFAGYIYPGTVKRKNQ